MSVSGLVRRTSDERGAGLITALMVMLIVFALGATWTGVGIHQVETSSFAKRREQALNAAEAGVNYAISRLAGDLHYAGTTSPSPMADGTGEFEVTVTPVDPANPDDLNRYIVAKGYAPSKAGKHRAARQVEQQVAMQPDDGFDYALFATPGGVIGQNNATITGDVYSAADVTLANYTKVYGNVVTRGSLTTTNNDVIGGDVHALQNVTLDNTQTEVQGSLYAGGNVSLTGTVDGNIQAGGTVTNNGSVAGTIASPSTPDPPPTLTQPSFTWDPSNYSSAYSFTDASGFGAWWSSHTDSFSGAYRVNGSDSTGNTVALDKSWNMGGDVIIYANGPIKITRDVQNTSGHHVTLAFITDSVLDPAIELSNNVTLNDPSITVLLFAPDGVIDFSQLKTFEGVVYAKTIRLSQQFTLSHAPPEVAGFSWSATSATHFTVKLRTFREVPFGS